MMKELPSTQRQLKQNKGLIVVKSARLKSRKDWREQIRLNLFFPKKHKRYFRCQEYATSHEFECLSTFSVLLYGETIQARWHRFQIRSVLFSPFLKYEKHNGSNCANRT